MKAVTVFKLAMGLLMLAFVSLALRSFAQETDNLEPSEKFSREELTQMLAPIALYPDALLSQILMASTYPIEVIEADRWVKKNPGLTGSDLDNALLNIDWDPSVKAVCHFPTVLDLMSERISQTTSIGNAFLAQEDEVMDVIQELRNKAYAQGNLTTNSEQKVIVEKETIIIEPADPQVIYVPYYDPFYVYGPWWYPAYPPYYWVPYGTRIGRGIYYWPAFYFGYAFGTWSYFDWHRHYVHIDVYKRPRYVRSDYWRVKPGPWLHYPEHRRGVAYRDKGTARKYGQYPYSYRQFRRDTRGFPEHSEGGGFQLPHRVVPLEDQRSRFAVPGQTSSLDIPPSSPQGKPEQKPKRIGQEQKLRERVEQVQQEQAGAAQQKLRTGQELQEQFRTQQERQQQAIVDQQSRQRNQVELNRQEQMKIEQQNRIRQLPEQVRQQPRQVQQQPRQVQQQPRQEQQLRQPADQNRQMRELQTRQQPAEQARMTQQRVQRELQSRSLDNVFNGVEIPRVERQSERGRTSRQGGVENVRGMNQGNIGNRGGHDGGRGGKSR